MMSLQSTSASFMIICSTNITGLNRKTGGRKHQLAVVSAFLLKAIGQLLLQQLKTDKATKNISLHIH